MVVNYRGKEIEISDKFGTEWERNCCINTL